MNAPFPPPIVQLDLFDVESAPRPPSRTTSYWRGKIAHAVAAALDIGRKQDSRRQALPPLHPAPPRATPFVPARAERDELLAIAARLSRLSISRKDPESFS
jgi:hypothetical protein